MEDVDDEWYVREQYAGYVHPNRERYRTYVFKRSNKREYVKEEEEEEVI